jgi:hypothetical protein
LENLLCDNSTNAVSIVFHTCCGYLITAMTLHRLFKALKYGIDPTDEVTLARVIIFIETLLKKPWISRGENLFRELMTHVDLSKVNQKEKKKERKISFSLIHPHARNSVHGIEGRPRGFASFAV